MHQGNIGAVADCQRVVAEVLEQHGRIDILVNNAGITSDRTVRRMASDDWDRVVTVNLSGAFYMSRAVLDPMLGAGYGRIVNISSVIGETGNIGQANYAAAKSGLFGLTKTLALETARKGITVNCVAPGFIATDMVDRRCPRRFSRTSLQTSRSDASASPRRSRAWSSSSSTPMPDTSPARSSPSTEG